MRARPFPPFLLWLVVGICLGVACALPAYQVTGGSGASSATGGMGGAGASTGGSTSSGGMPCTDASTCPAPSSKCSVAACTGGVCTTTPTPADAPCSTTMTNQGGFCDGMGACVQCTQDSECSGVTNDCRRPACNNHACGSHFTAAGTPTTTSPPQMAGDCHQVQCDGAGATTDAVDDTDLPSTGSAGVCKTGHCTGGNPSFTDNPGVMCGGTMAMPALCNAQGQCGCASNADCTPPNTCGGGGTAGTCGCTPMTCVAQKVTCGSHSDACFGTLACDDATKDGTETDVDCGGSVTTCATRCAQGKKCLVTSDCASGLTCADGVCCNTACTGTCQACTAAKKGSGMDGVCGAVKAGTDPDVECPTSAPATCKNAGGCDGAAACQQYPLGTPCGSAGCVGSVLKGASTCNGSGTCVAGSMTNCSPYLCTAGACTTSCTADPQCASGGYCNTITGKCIVQGGPGALCTAADQCTSGICDARCCTAACAAPCGTCDATGACVAVAKDQQPTGCNGTQACDGQGSCKIADGQTCTGGATVCVSGMCTNGGPMAGVCCEPVAQPCGAAGSCCSGVCTAGACACAASPSGSCVSATDCCKGACTVVSSLFSVKACCAPNGGACVTNTDCCSGKCGAGGVCKCVGATGASCTAFDANFCCNGTCGVVPAVCP